MLKNQSQKRSGEMWTTRGYNFSSRKIQIPAMASHFWILSTAAIFLLCSSCKAADAAQDQSVPDMTAACSCQKNKTSLYETVLDCDMESLSMDTSGRAECRGLLRTVDLSSFLITPYSSYTSARRGKRSEQVCIPRTTFKADCNTCFCSEDGTSMGCTLMACTSESALGKKRLFEPRSRRNSESKSRKDEQTCEPGSSFKQDCNDCICSPDGRSAACTLMECLPKEFYKQDGSIKLPHELFKNPLLRNRRDAQVCEPRSVFKRDCNSCLCSPDGTFAACTLMECFPGEQFTEDERVKLPHETLENPLLRSRRDAQVCEPKSSFKKDCNSCVCSADGTFAACTMIECMPNNLFNEDGSVKLPHEALENPLLRSRRDAQVCEPKSTFKKDCNSCVCSKDGMFAACTMMECLPDGLFNEDGSVKLPHETLENPLLRSRRDSQVCEPKSTFNIDCNRCICSEDGKNAACTLMECLPKEFYREDGTIKLPHEMLKNPLLRSRRDTQTCKPGLRFKKDCNFCVCSPNGWEEACTRLECPPKEFYNEDGTIKLPYERLNNPLLRSRRNAQVCTPGSHFKKDCNDCACSPDGTVAACTRMECLPKELYNEDGSIKLPHEALENPLLRSRRETQNCIPGSHFKIDCNNCTCSPDGTVAACTRMECLPKELYNEDGSIKLPHEALENPLLRNRRHYRSCEPGLSFKLGCQICICSSDGSEASCTRSKCSPDTSSRLQRSLKTPDFLKSVQILSRDEPTVCVPSSVLLNECKYCSCNDQGTKFSCTFATCPAPLHAISEADKSEDSPTSR
ncbi:uncharacterized protein LOC105694520 [Orussus abietinus]|uniref:uncharacterized protein LOC105694520 n=1 Tax=Orussus abietinus TaxID=222816 RepID=UPI000624FAB7|nr:uncharacterized protein LOC105694520 [Orussus abietinus]